MKYGDMYVNSNSISMQQQSKYTFRLIIIGLYICNYCYYGLDYSFGTQMVIVISNDVTVKNIFCYFIIISRARRYIAAGVLKIKCQIYTASVSIALFGSVLGCCCLVLANCRKISSSEVSFTVMSVTNCLCSFCNAWIFVNTSDQCSVSSFTMNVRRP